MNPFGNRIWCQCGGKMYARTDSPKYHCRTCNRKIPVETFEELMRHELYQFYGSKEQVAVRMNDAKKNLVDTEQALAALQRQIQKVREDMKQTHQLFLDKLITPQGFSDLYNPAEERLNQLLAGLPKLEADVARMKIDQVSVEEVIFEARNLYEQWPKLDIDRKRSVIESIFEKVEVGEGKINITYSGLPSSEELCKSQQQSAVLGHWSIITSGYTAHAKCQECQPKCIAHRRRGKIQPMQPPRLCLQSQAALPATGREISTSAEMSQEILYL
jgi:hypothetical protein